MNDKTCIVSVAFRQPYLEHNSRQGVALSVSSPKVHTLYFTDSLPIKDGLETNDIVGTFQKSLYGFKPHAIQRAINIGYKKIIWLDPSVLPSIHPLSDINILVRALDEHPMIVRIGDAPIDKMCNEKAFKWFGLSQQYMGLAGVKHIGGTVYAFNFNDPKVMECFNLWKKAEEEGIFGTQDDFMASHWADEACMALAMYKVGIPQYWEEKFIYLNQKEL